MIIVRIVKEKGKNKRIAVRTIKNNKPDIVPVCDTALTKSLAVSMFIKGMRSEKC